MSELSLGSGQASIGHTPACSARFLFGGDMRLIAVAASVCS